MQEEQKAVSVSQRRNSSQNNKWKRSSRICDKKAFDKVFRFGKKIRLDPFLFYYIPSQNSYSRAGFIIKRGSVRSAVQRNQVKRQLREFFRKTVLSANDKDTYDFVCVFVGVKRKDSFLTFVGTFRKKLESIWGNFCDQ